MPYNVKVKDNNMQVFLANQGVLISNYKIGDALLAFAYYDLKEFKVHFLRLINAVRFYKNFDNGDLMGKLKGENIYLNYFFELYFEYMQPDGITIKKSFDEFRKRFQESEMVLAEEKKKATPPQQLLQNCVQNTVLMHAQTMQNYIKGHFEFCLNYENGETTSGLTPLQRLYLYEKWGLHNRTLPSYYERTPFISQLTDNSNFDIAGENLTQAAMRMKMHDIDIAEVYVINSGWTLLRFELIKLMAQDVTIKLCSNCNKYFIPEGRVDSEYCSRITADEPSKTCAIVGAMKKYQNKISDKPAYFIYTKAYKRLNSRVRLNKMTKEDFSAWSKKARKMRDKCLDEKISLNEFESWLQKF